MYKEFIKCLWLNWGFSGNVIFWKMSSGGLIGLLRLDDLIIKIQFVKITSARNIFYPYWQFAFSLIFEPILRLEYVE